MVRALAGAAGVVLVMSVCRDGGSGSTDRSVLRVGLSSPWSGLSPRAGETYEGAQYALLVFEGLTVVDEDGAVHPGLARAWDESDDARTWTFHLRNGVHFHDGTLFTAMDVKRSWEESIRAEGPEGPPPWMLEPLVGSETVVSGAASGLAGVGIPDDSTVVVELDRPMAPFPSFVALPQAAVVAPTSSPESPVGTGPWEYVSGHPDEGTVTLARAEDYWGRRPFVDGLTLRILPDTLAQRALEAGRIDYTTAVVSRTRVALATSRSIGFVASEPLMLIAIALDTRIPIYRDVRVRRALSHAVDVPSLMRAVGTDGVPATGAIPPSWTGGDRHRDPYDYDPAGARELLRQAGYPPDREIRLAAQGWDYGVYPARRIARLVRDYWRAVGLDVTVVDDDAPWDALAAGEVDAALYGFGPDYNDPDAMLYPLFHSETAGSAGNPGYWSDPETDRLIERERAAGPGDRVAALRDVDARLFDQAARVFLWFTSVSAAYSLDFTGWRATPFVPRFVDVRPAR